MHYVFVLIGDGGSSVEFLKLHRIINQQYQHFEFRFNILNCFNLITIVFYYSL